MTTMCQQDIKSIAEDLSTDWYKDVSVRGDLNSVLHFFLHCWFTSSILLFFSLILLCSAPSFCRSFSQSQRPPTHFSFCCKYRGLNGMVLYLAGRCAITRDHLDHNRTPGLRFEARHVLSLPLSVWLLLPQFFGLCPLSHFCLLSY